MRVKREHDTRLDYSPGFGDDVSDLSDTAEFPECGVSIGPGTFNASGLQYELAGVTGADVVRVPKAATGPILMLSIGGICLLSSAGEAGPVGAVLGVGLIASGGLWWSRKKPVFQLCLRGPQGAPAVFESPDADLVERLAAAVRERLGAPH
jgi:hypothetical protein